MVFARRHPGLKSFTSDRVRKRMPSSADLNECFRRTEKNMLKSAGASTQPCFTPQFTPLLMSITSIKHASIILHSALCPIMKWLDVAKEFWRAAS